MKCMRKYVAKDVELKTAATVLGGSFLATYAHGDHVPWGLATVHTYIASDGSTFEARVVVRDDSKDVIILQSDLDAEAPPIRFAIFEGVEYLLLGGNARHLQHAGSCTHGCIGTTAPDAHLHVRGDAPSARGDAGGGLFLTVSGHLIGMNVACDEHQRAVLVHVSTLLLLRDQHLRPSKISHAS
jgi:hypothetical protein